MVKVGWLRVAAIYFFCFLLFTFVFLLLFHTPLWAEQKVLFYRGLGLLVVSSLLVSTLAMTIRRVWREVRIESLVAAVIISLSLHLSFFVVFPVTFDRSVTMYLLSSLENRRNDLSCSGKFEDSLEKNLIEEYIVSRRAVRRRLNEQSIIGMIEERNNCAQLSSTGTLFLKFAGLVKKLYGVVNE